MSRLKVLLEEWLRERDGSYGDWALFLITIRRINPPPRLSIVLVRRSWDSSDSDPLHKQSVCNRRNTDLDGQFRMRVTRSDEGPCYGRNRFRVAMYRHGDVVTTDQQATGRVKAPPA